MKTVRKLLVSLLSLALLMSVLVVPAFAEGEPTLHNVALDCSGNGAIAIELQNVDVTKEVKIELYSASNLLTTVTLNKKDLEDKVYSALSCYIPLDAADSYWPYTAWTPLDNVVPDKAVLYIGGEEVSSKEAGQENWQLPAEKWVEVKGTLEPATGSIESSLLLSEKDRISTDAKDIHYFDSVEFKLYSTDGLMVSATLKDSVNLDGYPFITCPIYINQADREAEEAWKYSDWTPMDNVVPQCIELWLDGKQMDTEEVTVDTAAWAALEDTQAPIPEEQPQPEYPEYYPDYDENQPIAQAPAAQEPVEQPVVDEDVSPKTGEQGMYVALVALAAAAAVVLCARKAAMSR